jgi:hypothetical protein
VKKSIHSHARVAIDNVSVHAIDPSAKILSEVLRHFFWLRVLVGADWNFTATRENENRREKTTHRDDQTQRV